MQLFFESTSFALMFFVLSLTQGSFMATAGGPSLPEPLGGSALIPVHVIPDDDHTWLALSAIPPRWAVHEVMQRKDKELSNGWNVADYDLKVKMTKPMDYHMTVMHGIDAKQHADAAIALERAKLKFDDFWTSTHPICVVPQGRGHTAEKGTAFWVHQYVSHLGDATRKELLSTFRPTSPYHPWHITIATVEYTKRNVTLASL